MGGGGSVRPPTPRSPIPTVGSLDQSVVRKGEDARKRIVASAEKNKTIFNNLGGPQEKLGSILLS